MADTAKDYFQEFKEAWRAFLLEFLGTLILVLVGCGSAVASTNTAEIALCFGFTVAIVVQAICHISGGHINPAVTVGILIAGHINILNAICYIIAQLLGAVAGAAILYGCLPDGARGALGQTSLNEQLNVGHGMGIELLITFTLVFVVLTVAVENRETEPRASPPLFVGLTVAACHMWAIKYTGSSMNTARSFGPAVVAGFEEAHWIYWAGPILGGIIAGVLYRFVFALTKKGGSVIEKSEA